MDEPKIKLGSKVFIGNNAMPKFTRGMRGTVVDAEEADGIYWVDLDHFPANRKNSIRTFWGKDLTDNVVKQDNRLIAWLNGS